MGYLALGVVVINNTDKTITVGIKNSSINGWRLTIYSGLKFQLIKEEG